MSEVAGSTEPSVPLLKDVDSAIRGYVDLLKGNLNALVVCLSRSWGGLEQVAAQDSLELAALGLEVRVLCLEGTPVHENLAHRREVQVVPLQKVPRNTLDLEMRRILLRFFADGVNLVHTHQTSLLASIVPWVWRRPAISVVATRHIMNNHDKRTLFHRAIYRRLDALIVMSRALKKNVLDTHPLRERDVHVVNLGLDFERFDPTQVDASAQRRAWGADDDTLVIGLVGRIDPAKGQATFIRAAAGLMKSPELARRARFVIVGEETLGSTANYLQELREMVRQFGLEDQVVFAGFQTNIPEIMRAFDVFVMPSRQEAFGLVAIEAMAMGCPIIISSGGSSDEIIGNEEFGLRVRPDDAFDLQCKLQRMLSEPDLRESMGRRAREHVVAHFDRKLRLLRTLEIYERALRRRRPFA